MYAKGCDIERCAGLADRDAWIPATAYTNGMWAEVALNVCLDHFLAHQARPLTETAAA